MMAVAASRSVHTAMASMKRPALDAMTTAAEWLDINEGDEGEADECKAIAKWLRAQIEAAEVRAIAKETGVSTAIARKAMNTIKSEMEK